MFVADVRTSTVLGVAAFVSVAVIRRDRRPLIAAAAWLFGFEAVFQIADFTTGFPLRWPSLQFFVDMSAVVIPAAVAGVLWWRGIRPEARLFVAALAVFAVWVATGFHVNQHNGLNFNASAEVLNETTKTLWAAAYLLPLLVWNDEKGRPTRRRDGHFWIRRVDGRPNPGSEEDPQDQIRVAPAAGESAHLLNVDL